MNGMEQVEYDREVADLRAGMSEAQFKEAWNKGREMSMEDAVALALT
jgi:hypothetical protein